MVAITENVFNKLTDFIKNTYGIHLKKEKKALVTGRLQNILLEKKFKNFSEYYEYIISDKTGYAAASLANRITTNHTYFMREPEHFLYLKE
jgi:chemotaxis protein methyltransferase CheR